MRNRYLIIPVVLTLVRHCYTSDSYRIWTDVSQPVYDLCPSDRQNVTVTCHVTGNFTDHTPVFSLLVDPRILMENQTGLGSLPSGYFYVMYSFRPDRSGIINIECQVDVLEFHLANNTRLQVREPPKKGPRLYLATDDSDSFEESVTVEIGQTLLVTCLVSGGVPLVDSILLVCGQSRQENPSNQVTLGFIVDRSMRQLTCFCRAHHPTQCYTNSTEVVLKFEIHEGSKIQPRSPTLVIVVASAVTGFLVLLIIITVVIILRVRRRREEVRTPDPALSPPRVDHKPVYHLPSTASGSHTYVGYCRPPAYSPARSPKEVVYDEITPPPDYIDVVLASEALAGAGRATVRNISNDYIQPIA